jgi:aspartate racemase
MKTIGIVGGIGPESTIDYYRSIIALFRKRRTDENYPQIIINSVNLTEMLELLEAGKLRELTQSLSEAVERLEQAGADFAVFASNTPHLLFDDIQKLSPIPLLSIVEETCKKAVKVGLTRLGLFGTRFTMQGGFYQTVFKRHGVTIVVPDSDDQAYIHHKYMTELVSARIIERTRNEFSKIAARLKKKHSIHGLILGGTELPLLLAGTHKIDMPILNTTEIHVESIIDFLE